MDPRNPVAVAASIGPGPCGLVAADAPALDGGALALPARPTKTPTMHAATPASANQDE